MPEQIGAASADPGEAWGQAVAEDKLLKRVSGEPDGRPGTLSEFFDPTAFEERLKLARARRAVALAQREATGLPLGPRVPALRRAEAGLRGTDPIVMPGFAAPPRTLPRRDSERAETVAPRAANSPTAWLRAVAALIIPAPNQLLSRLRPLAPARRTPLAAGLVLAGLAVATLALILAPGHAPAPAAAPQIAPSVAPIRTAALAVSPAAEPTLAPAPPIENSSLPAQVPVAAEPPAAVPAQIPAQALAPRLAGGPNPRPRTLGAPAETALAAQVDQAATSGQDLSGIRVFVHFPPSVGASTRAATVSDLEAAGFPTVEPIRAAASIDTTNVRYFHAEDAEAAHQLAAALGGGAVVRDFTDLSPPPRKGRLEVWMRGVAPQPPAAAPEAILQMLQARSQQN